jgi:hypothetical protein
MLYYVLAGDKRLERILEEIPVVLDTEAILDEGAAVLFNRQRTRFLQQVAPTGIPWLPSFAAIRHRRATLYDTGKLFRSIQLFASGPNQRSIGTDVTDSEGFPYGEALQYGWGNLVPREFLGFNEDEDVPYMLDLVFDRIEKAFTL